MKRALAALVCVTTVGFLAAPRACAWDPVDALLQDDERQVTDESVTRLLSTDAPAIDSLTTSGPAATTSAAEANNITTSPSWQSAGGREGASDIGATDIEAANLAARPLSNPTHADAPAGSASPVPEPSAIILALVALAYFLLFGRRRRMA
jgi:hypothetical protein